MPTFTLADLETRVWDHLDGNIYFYPEANVRSCINEGLRVLNLLIGWYQDTISVPGFSVAGQISYSVPAGIVIPIRVYYEGRELERVSLRKLADKFRNWASDESAYNGPVARWCPLGVTRFIIHPRDSTAGRWIEVSGVATIIPLVNQTDVVALDDEYVDILVDYVRSRIMLKEGGKPFADASVAYTTMIQKVKPLLAWKRMTFPRYFTIDVQRRTAEEHDAATQEVQIVR
jgi:hypothetical protein